MKQVEMFNYSSSPSFFQFSVNQQSSENEEAVVGDNMHNVTSSKALTSIGTIRTFISPQSNVLDYIYTNILQLQNYLISIKTPNLVQCSEENCKFF